MSSKQELQDTVKALKKAKQEDAEKVNKAATQVDTVRQVQTEQSSRLD
ncbi:unnamed protein product [marine sediment metagenome]|uniref:Uncharacterized protein n=1 Tax=marine sediment metagenome TaxID=412755 RepID=X1RUL6_9ZZZZ